MIPSYPSIYSVGHRYIAELLTGDVVIQEKVDGSQISFGVLDGQLHIRSKGQQMVVSAPEKLFAPGVEYIKSIAGRLEPGIIYRGEYLSKPKHNTLAYDRIPRNHIVLFDVESIGRGDFLPPALLPGVAESLGLESVPTFFTGSGSYDSLSGGAGLQEFLSQQSFLGGQRIEGVVVKNYNVYTQSKHIAIGKFVSAEFKEIHRHAWKAANPGPNDFVQGLINTYRTPARFNKAIQHLRDAGKLVGTPVDIGELMKEVPADVLRECGDEIKKALFDHFWQVIRRGITNGLPEYYKKQLGIVVADPVEQATVVI